MKKIKSVAVVLIGVILACALLFTACGEPETPVDPVVPAKTLTRIVVTEKPTKLTYLIGEKFDKTGMVLTAYYDDGTSEAVTDYKVDKTEALTTGDNTVTITYGGKVALLSINVTIEVEEMLKIESAENKVYTVEAENLDYSHCVNSNDPAILPNVEVSGDASNSRSIGSLSVAGNMFGFAVESEAEADLTIVMRASAVSVDVDLDLNMDFVWNNTYEMSGHVLPWTDNFWGWDNAYYNDLKLEKGTNILTMKITAAPAPNIDCFYLIVNPTGEEKLPPDPESDPGETPDYDTFLTVESDAAQSYTVEAEALDYSKCISSNDPDGTPNFEVPQTVTSGDKCVSSLGVTGNRFGMKVNSAVAADLKLTMVVSSGNPNEQVLDNLMKILWNGSVIKTNYTVTWEKDRWHHWENATIEGLKLKEGENVLDMLIIANGAPNIDCFIFEVSPASEQPDDPDPVEPTFATFVNITADNNEYAVEAEALDYSECVNSNNHEIQPNIERPTTTTSGDASVGGLGVIGNRFGMTVNSTVAGTVTLTMVVSSGSGTEQIVDDLLEIKWNGEKITTNHTIAWNETWHQWENMTISGLTLNADDNVLDIKVIGGGCPNFDCFRFEVSPASGQPDDPDPVEPAYATFLNVTGAESKVYTVEAEALDYSDCISSNNPDGQPNTETPGTPTSGRLCVSSLGVTGNEFGLTVNSTVSADLSIVLRVSSGTNSDQILDDLLEIKWNGTKLTTGATIVYEENVWHNWKHVYLNDLTLNADDNVLSIKVIGGGAPNFDCFYFVVAPTGEEVLGPDTGDKTPEYGTFVNVVAGTDAYTVEAEALDYSDCINSNNHAIPPNEERPSTETSGGASIGSLGVVGNRFGMTVNSTVAGTVTLTMVVSSGSGTEQIVDDLLEIKWNGEKITTNHTIAWNETWHQWENITISGLTLNADDNVLDIKVIGGGSPNFDCFKFEVTPAV